MLILHIPNSIMRMAIEKKGIDTRFRDILLAKAMRIFLFELILAHCLKTFTGKVLNCICVERNDSRRLVLFEAGIGYLKLLLAYPTNSIGSLDMRLVAESETTLGTQMQRNRLFRQSELSYVV
jgi:hypothetical protein